MGSSEITLVLFFTGALVLAWSGVAKVWRPGQLVRALDAAGLRVGPAGVRLIGALEVALGSLGLVHPTALVAAGIGAAYVVFATFLSYLLVRKPALESCGCAGSRQTPPSWLHVALDGIAGGAAFASMATHGDPQGFISVAATLPVAGVSFLAGIALLAYLAFLCTAYLPGALAAYQAGR